MGIVLTIVLVVVVALLIGFAIANYNGLVKRRNDLEESWRQIDVQLKRSYDLIPNLLEGVKKYFRQEQEVLTEDLVTMAAPTKGPMKLPIRKVPPRVESALARIRIGMASVR